MRHPHVVISDEYPSPEWDDKLKEWAGIAASWMTDGIYIRTQSGFGGSQAFFPTEQIDELIGLFQDIKAEIDAAVATGKKPQRRRVANA